MQIILAIIFWILQALLILAIFQSLVPIVVNGLTRNSWIKLPIMLILSIPAGAFMAWLKYKPYLLFFLWLALNKYSLEAMMEKKFESEAGMKINKPLFYLSTYSYTILSCLLAWFFQIEMINGDLLWKNLLLN